MGNASSTKNSSKESSSTLGQREAEYNAASSDAYQTAKGEAGLTAVGGYNTAKEASSGKALGATLNGGATAITGLMAIRDSMKGWDNAQKAQDCANAKLEKMHHERNEMSSDFNMGSSSPVISDAPPSNFNSSPQQQP